MPLRHIEMGLKLTARNAENLDVRSILAAAGLGGVCISAS
jgi:hypothetical protein